MRQQITNLLHECGLSRVSGEIEQCLKASLLLRSKSMSDDQLPVGATKLGGLPDLAPGVTWPVWQGKPQSLIAQINLAGLPQAQFLTVLPASGLLSFFYNSQQETWGFDPKDKGSWCVLYNDGTTLQRRAAPDDIPEQGLFASCAIEWDVTMTAPPWESSFVEGLALSEEEGDMYRSFAEAHNEMFGVGERAHRLLGHPDQIQGPMQEQCQLVSHGLYCGDASGYQDPRAASLAPGATNWEMLLQIDSDDNAGMMWGDVGRLYYWIQQDDLQHKRFEATWLVSQCY